MEVMDKTNDILDIQFRLEAIRFFKSLIKRRTGLGIDTRPVNFAGNIGRQMSRNLKKWFLNKYPNNSDYVKFFLENDGVFHYDLISGNVTPNGGADRPFATPDFLARLETICSDKTIGLKQLSGIVFEVELFIVVFKSFVDSYKLKKTYELMVSQLAEDLSEDKYQKMFSELKDIVVNPKMKRNLFEDDLMEYLDSNYKEIFAVDRTKQCIRLHLQVIEGLKKVWQTLDDTIYKVFEYLLAKYLEKNGPKEVDLLFEAISERHPFIVGHIFKQNITADDYTLLDFCQFNRSVFKMTGVDGPDGRFERIIDIRRPEPEAEEVIDNEIYNSDDDVYLSDDETENVSTSYH